MPEKCTQLDEQTCLYKLKSNLLQDVYLTAFALNIMLDASTILLLTRNSKPESGKESGRYVEMGKKLLDVSILILNCKTELRLTHQQSCIAQGELISKLTSKYIELNRSENFSDIQWLEVEIAECQRKTISAHLNSIGPEGSDCGFIINTIQLAKRALTLNEPDLPSTLAPKLVALKAFALKASTLLNEKIQKSPLNQHHDNNSFFKAIKTYIPAIWIINEIFISTPAIELCPTFTLEDYMMRIRSLIFTAKDWCEANVDDSDFMFSILEQCLTEAKLVSMPAFPEHSAPKSIQP